MIKKSLFLSSLVVLSAASQLAQASCNDIIAVATNNQTVLSKVVGAQGNGGYGLPMWVAAVDETDRKSVV